MTDLSPVDAMTNEFRAMCAELVDSVELLLEMRAVDAKPMAITEDRVSRARALLAQPVAEEPTDDEIEEWADACSEAPPEEMDPEIHGWRRCFTAKEFSETIRAALARWGTPPPQAEDGDIHYAWELHDDEGEWQAGGSAITLESVRREGNHYLQTYSQDGPHTLIIYRASTIEEVTND